MLLLLLKIGMYITKFGITVLCSQSMDIICSDPLSAPTHCQRPPNINHSRPYLVFCFNPREACIFFMTRNEVLAEVDWSRMMRRRRNLTNLQHRRV